MRKIASVVMRDDVESGMAGHAALENPSMHSPEIPDSRRLLVSGWIFDWHLKDDVRVIIEDVISRREHGLILPRPDLLRVLPRATWRTGFCFHHQVEPAVKHLRLSIKLGLTILPWCVIAISQDESGGRPDAACNA